MRPSTITLGRIGLLAALTAGAIFRLIWLQDIEYKGDQAWTFTEVQKFWATGRLPLIGMPSSVWLPNPGMSLWVFIALSAFVPIEDPLALTRAVEVLNIIALLLLALFVGTCVDRSEREPWRWSVALVSVNPFMVLFSRCIWTVELFPIFTLGLLLGWWHRRRWWGAFLWGLIGAVLGQIHLGGYFFAAAFFLGVLLFNRRSVHWPTWFAGSALGALPMIPWLVALADRPQGMSSANLINLAPVFVARWFDIALGLGLRQSLGHSFIDFVAQPRMDDSPTYLVAVLLAAIAAIASTIALRLVRRLRSERHRMVAPFFDLRSPTVLALACAGVGYGLLLSLTLRHVYIHYFIIVFSLPALSVAWAAHAGSGPTEGSRRTARLLLAGLALAQATVTTAFLWYIHDRQVIDGDYGTVYHALPAADGRKP